MTAERREEEPARGPRGRVALGLVLGWPPPVRVALEEKTRSLTELHREMTVSRKNTQVCAELMRRFDDEWRLPAGPRGPDWGTWCDCEGTISDFMWPSWPG